MTVVSATEMQNNFGKYLKYVIEGNEVIILKKGKEVARLISKEKATDYLADSLCGVLKNDYDDKTIRQEKVARYENLG